MEKNSIVLISCFIGPLPWYFDYFAFTCKYNPSIDFIIITDDRSYNKQIPVNVKFIYKNLSELNTLASAKLGFETNIDTPYKICDFKPTYGLLFADLISHYDFWGHMDIDIVFGNIRNFITDEILDGHDLIAVRDDFLTGYFLLFRNNEKMKMLFTHSKDYKKVLTEKRHFCFDETNFHFGEFEVKNHYSKIESEVESMTHVVKRLSEDNYIRAYFDFHVIEGAYGKLFWENGKLLYKSKFEVLLYHLILFKNIFKPKYIFKVPSSFNISPTRIYTRKRKVLVS